MLERPFVFVALLARVAVAVLLRVKGQLGRLLFNTGDAVEENPVVGFSGDSSLHDFCFPIFPLLVLSRTLRAIRFCVPFLWRPQSVSKLQAIGIDA